VGQSTARRRVTRVSEGAVDDRVDTLATEEPLEIRVDGRAVSVTMRTPGDDLDLALGFLTTEGADVATATACADNVIDVTVRSMPDLQRNFYTSSSCGMCGKSSIDAVRTASRFDVRSDDAPLDPGVLVTLPEQLRTAQRAFARTGGLHAAGLFRDGERLCVREDVGRHNAVDKVIGWAVQRDMLPLAGTVLQVSGRASFELVQKALMAGIPVLAAVSAPSSLAVELADEAGMTLIGFLRGTSYNIYTGAHRLKPVGGHSH
jgi:FdhD protein